MRRALRALDLSCVHMMSSLQQRLARLRGWSDSAWQPVMTRTVFTVLGSPYVSFTPVKMRLSSTKTCQASTWATWAAGDNRAQIIFQSLKKMVGGAERQFWCTPELVDMLNHFIDVRSVSSSSLPSTAAPTSSSFWRSSLYLSS